jgi:hypothetical protein
VVLSKETKQSNECRRKILKRKLYTGVWSVNLGRNTEKNWENNGKFIKHEMYTLKKCNDKKRERKRREKRKKKLSRKL